MEACGALATAPLCSRFESSTRMQSTISEFYHVPLHASQSDVSKRTRIGKKQIVSVLLYWSNVMEESKA